MKIKDILKSLRLVLSFHLFLLWAPAAVCGFDQPQWGQRHSRNMVSLEKGLAESFDPETKRNIKWSAPLGTQTHPTPVISGGKVFIGTNNRRPRDLRHQGDRGILLCLDEEDGSLIWQLVVPKLEDRYGDWPQVGISSPATVEGDRVYLVSNRGEVLCLDIHGQADGNDGPFRNEGQFMSGPGNPPIGVGPRDADILWVFDMRVEVGVKQHDSSNGSILIDGEFLYVTTSNGVDGTHRQVPAPEAVSLIVLEKSTGRLVAKDGVQIGRQIVHNMWSSPSLGRVGGRDLIFFGGGNAICYAFEAMKIVPDNKVSLLKEVWRFDCDPTGPKGNPSLHKGNRRVSPSIINGMCVFDKGRVYVTAGGDVWHGKRQAWLKCIDATKTGDITGTGELWSHEIKHHCMSTPSVMDGLVFIADCGKEVSCLDAETGRVYWVHKTRGDIWGSTLVADGKVYIGTRNGDFWILAAAKEKKVLFTVKLESGMSASPVAANGVLYIATMETLYAVQEKSK